RASSISACTVVAARRRTSPSLISEQRSRPPMSATKALTRSRKRRAVAERPSRPGNRSLWFVTAERVRDGNSAEGDDTVSTTGRFRLRDFWTAYWRHVGQHTVRVLKVTIHRRFVACTRMLLSPWQGESRKRRPKGKI